MSISYGSMLSDGERVFTVTVDRYEKGVMEGVLYLGDQLIGRNFSGYVALVRMIEEYFEQIRYPRPVMDLRELQLSKNIGTIRAEQEWIPRRFGGISSYVIRVTQRQNASWQGIVVKEDGAVCRFLSFLDLVACLEKNLVEQMERKASAGYRKSKPNQEKAPEHKEELRSEKVQEGENALNLEQKEKQKRVEQYLEIVMGFPKVEQIMPDTLQYHFQMENRSRTFVVRFLFFENRTCQGILYWQEGHREESFRSFLELVLMMSGAIGDETYFPCE